MFDLVLLSSSRARSGAIEQLTCSNLVNILCGTLCGYARANCARRVPSKRHSGNVCA